MNMPMMEMKNRKNIPGRVYIHGPGCRIILL
jgi:hypothetical protein